MTRILWITRQDPRAANAGDLIYTLGLLRSLAATGEVALTVLAHRDGDAPESISGIDWTLPCPMPKKSALSLLSPLPSDAHRMGSPAMREALDTLLRDHAFDRVVIDQAACGWALDALPADLPLLYLAHNHEAVVRKEIAADATGLMAPLMKLDAEKYARLEKKLCARATWISAITPRDEKNFRSEFPNARYLVSPPGFDREIPGGDLPEITTGTPRKVVLAGTFEWVAKRRNLEDFLESASGPFQAGGIEFQVVGKADPDYFRELAKKHPWATFDANVPSMDPYLRDARIGLIPEALGGGFKLKALDYIFRGLPLASIESALSGLPVVPGKTAIAAHSTHGLVNAVAVSIDDLGFLNQVARGALDACRDAFDWADRGRTLAAVLSEKP